MDKLIIWSNPPLIKLLALTALFYASTCRSSAELIQDAQAIHTLIKNNHPGIHKKHPDDLPFLHKFEKEMEQVLHNEF